MEKETLLGEPTERANGSREVVDLSSEDFRQRQAPDLEYDHKKPATVIQRLLSWLAHLVFLLASFSVLVKGIMVRSSLPANCTETRRQWLITMGSLSEEYHYERSDGTFERSSSPYKGPPSPAVDAAWEELTNYGAISIPEETYEKLNASIHAVKVPEDFGGGRLAFIEGIHQLHCLEYLWRHTYQEYYTEVAEKIKRNDQPWHEHMDHCVDMLRQKLMCDTDIHLLTHNWVKGHDAPHPNFNIARQCRNYDVIKQHALDHALDGSRLPKAYFEKPKDGSVMEYDEPPFDRFDEGSPSQP